MQIELKSKINLFLLKKVFLFFLLSTTIHLSYSQTDDRINYLDVVDYDFAITVNDTTDVIEAESIIYIKFKQEVTSFWLNLNNINADGKGMLISYVKENDKEIDYKHQDNKITIKISPTVADEVRTYTIRYSGIPADGLIIAENKYGDRTFFSDNWPNRASCWLAVVDNPADKARISFYVFAPIKYQVVSNGTKVHEFNFGNKFVTVWETHYPLATKVMSIGIAKFATHYYKHSSGLPMSSWVYPQNYIEGFADYKIADKAIDYYTTVIGDYPFDKLANVQSTTIFGGMENAGCIFYSENSVTGHQLSEKLIAHEISHQWFGNSVTEKSYSHIWLSEGFATYLTNLYVQYYYGNELFIEQMKDDRKTVIDYSRIRIAPVVDTTTTDYMDLLNPNSYQKAGWFLYMLHTKVGDTLFWQSVRNYHEKYKYGNADTKDFMDIVEETTNENVSQFFYQWLRVAGHPILKLNYTTKNNQLSINIKQTQKQYIFDFILEAKIKYVDGRNEKITMHIKDKNSSFSFEVRNHLFDIIFDPDAKLLFEEKGD